MPTLNIGGSATLKSYVKFNAKADKWFVRGTDGEDKEIQRPTFVGDFDNIKTGWMRLLEGQAPERVMDPSIDRAAPPPGGGFKRGFVLMVYSQKFFGGAAEFSARPSTSQTRSGICTRSTRRAKRRAWASCRWCSAWAPSP